MSERQPPLGSNVDDRFDVSDYRDHAQAIVRDAKARLKAIADVVLSEYVPGSVNSDFDEREVALSDSEIEKTLSMIQGVADIAITASLARYFGLPEEVVTASTTQALTTLTEAACADSLPALNASAVAAQELSNAREQEGDNQKAAVAQKVAIRKEVKTRGPNEE